MHAHTRPGLSDDSSGGTPQQTRETTSVAVVYHNTTGEPVDWSGAGLARRRGRDTTPSRRQYSTSDRRAFHLHAVRS